MKTETLIVEFDGPNNPQVFFQPLGRAIRGRFDSRRVAGDGRLYSQWPEVIPSQRLELNVSTGEAAIIEPLWNPEHTQTRERIESKGWKLLPGRETVAADVPTWVYWLKQLVETGTAKVVQGTLPDKINGKPKTRFVSAEVVDPIATLTDAINAQTAIMEKLLAKLGDK